MDKNAVVRLSDHTVVKINWDDEEKTGTGTVTDETTGEVYEIGGVPMSNLMKCTKSLNDDDQWVLNKTFNELKEAIDSGILPYLDAEITLGDVKCKRQLMLTGLSDESTNNPEPYYYVQFGAVKSGFVINFESSTPTEPMAMC